MGCSPWGCYKSDMTERLHFHFSLSCIGPWPQKRTLHCHPHQPLSCFLPTHVKQRLHPPHSLTVSPINLLHLSCLLLNRRPCHLLPLQPGKPLSARGDKSAISLLLAGTQAGLARRPPWSAAVAAWGLGKVRPWGLGASGSCGRGGRGTVGWRRMPGRSDLGSAIAFSSMLVCSYTEYSKTLLHSKCQA